MNKEQMQNLPTLEEYRKAGLQINPGITRDLDLSGWEGRLHLFMRVAAYATLHEDKRPNFTKWMKGLKFETKEEFQDYFELGAKYHVEPDEDDFWHDEDEDPEGDLNYYWEYYLENGEITPSLFMRCQSIYHDLFKDQKLVEQTPIGKFLEPYLNQIGHPDLHRYISSYHSSLFRLIEYTYKACVNNEDYKSMNVDWKTLCEKRVRCDYMGTFHRRYLDSNTTADIANPYGGCDSMVPEFLIGPVFAGLLKDFGVNIKDYVNIEDFMLPQEHDFGFLISSDESSIAESEFYQDFVQEFGQLWPYEFIDAV